MQWEIKVSKFCNLRCQYCYEFAELGNRERLSLENWRAIFDSVRWYHGELQQRNPNKFVHTELVWHGGEPLLLPVSYYEDVLALQYDMLGAENFPRVFSNHVPSNLYQLPPRTIDLLRRERFQLAVAFDGVGGTRLHVDGGDTEQRVAANMRQLLADGWMLACNTVVTAHNVSRLQRVYDTVRDWAYETPGHAYLNFIPLHATPTEGPTSAFSVAADACVDAMFDVFTHWLDDPRPMPLFRSQLYYLNVVRKLSGAPQQFFHRRTYGESSLMINTDGHVYVFNDAYDRDRSMGSLFEQPLRELMRSPAYERSLQRYEALVDRYCHGCEYDGYCDRETMITGRRDHPGRRCAVAYPMHRRIEEHLVARGFTPDTFEGGLPDLPRLEFVAE